MSIKFKFLFSISALVATLAFGLVAFEVNTTIDAVRNKAETQQKTAVQDISSLMDTTNDLMLQRVKGSMKLLQERSWALGMADIDDNEVNSLNTTNLYFGFVDQTNNHELVDRLTETVGGTATIFSRHNEDYTRIATNVIVDGKRGTGTQLSKTGRAVESIRRGEAYYGHVDILGEPYLAGYEPIRDVNNKTIGIWYVGYSADTSLISTAVARTKILDHGFVAIYDRNGVLRMHSENVNEKEITQALASPDKWNFEYGNYALWDYQIISAYPNAEVSENIWATSSKTVLFISLIGFGIIGLTACLVHYLVSKPLSNYIKSIYDIAEGEGDLTQRFERVTNDELGQMASGFNKLLERIHTTILQSKNATEKVQTSAVSLIQLANKTLESTQSQNKDTEQVAAASHEMSLSTQDIAKNTANAELHARNANEDVNKVSQTLTHTIQNIETQAETVQNSSQVVQELVLESHNISEILTVIGDIADQTNLLALNAAIEAARAGDHGRGFAVVADEVRQLASKTQSSTEEIRNMVERLQKSGIQATEQMKSSKKVAEDNVEQARIAGSVLQTVFESVEHISQLNVEIASAVEQQKYVAEDVSKNINLIREASNNNLDYADQTTRACETLNELADSLAQQLSHYRV